MNPGTVFAIALGAAVAVGQMRWYGLTRSTARAAVALRKKRPQCPHQIPNITPAAGGTVHPHEGVPQVA